MSLAGKMLKQFLAMVRPNSGKRHLHTPTQFCYLNGIFFIVDCWNNRIFLHPTTNPDLDQWQEIKGFHHPHRIAFHQDRYYIADTDNHRLVCLSPDFHRHTVIETTEHLNRPHDLLFFDQQLIVTDSQQSRARILSLALEPRFPVVREFTMDSAYCRSIRYIDGILYACDSGGGRIFLLDPRNLELLDIYCFAPDGGMMCSLRKDQQRMHPRRMIPNEIAKFKGRFFLSNYFYHGTRNRLISFGSLPELETGDYLDHSDLIKGVPYYMDPLDDRLLVGEIDDHSRCVEFGNTEGRLHTLNVIE